MKVRRPNKSTMLYPPVKNDVGSPCYICLSEPLVDISYCEPLNLIGSPVAQSLTENDRTHYRPVV